MLTMSTNLRVPLSSNELIFLLMKNMSLSLQYEMASIVPNSVAELVQRCVNAESTLYNKGRTQNTLSNYLKCWNYDENHRYHYCDIPIDKEFCFGCGMKGLLKPNCPTCNPINSGNYQEGVRATGA